MCGRETAHALVEKEGKVKDKYYGKLILDLGNEVRSSVEKEVDAMENLVRKLGNAEERVECKKLKKELERSKIEQHTSSVNEALTANRPRRANVSRAGGSRQGGVPAAHECTFSECNPTIFHGIEGAVELRRWFEKTKMVFGISEYAEGKKVATMGLEAVIQIPWNEMKQLMTAEFCPAEEVQRMEHELWNLKVKEFNIGEVTSSKSANLSKVVRMAHKLMEQKLQSKHEREMKGNKRKWENFQSGNSSRGNYKDNSRHQKNNQKQGNARAMTTAPNESNAPRPLTFKTVAFVRQKVVVRTSAISVKGWVKARRQYKEPRLKKNSHKVEYASVEPTHWRLRRKSKEKCLEDVPVIRDFPEVFPDDLLGLPPPRQVEFRIDLV
ncbi:hypothetical protein Tco_0942746 [Tanacetum coccineum]